MLNPELRESQPELAEVIDSLTSRFQRSYDFSRIDHQADFSEACHEIGMHIARLSQTGSIKIEVGARGVVGLAVNCSPA